MRKVISILNKVAIVRRESGGWRRRSDDGVLIDM